MRNQMQFLGGETQLQRLTKLGNPLEKLDRVIDWEIFRPLLETIRKNSTQRGGRPSLDEIMMFKIVMLQQWYALSDDAAEYQCNNRLDFIMRILARQVRKSRNICKKNIHILHCRSAKKLSEITRWQMPKRKTIV